MLAPQQEYAGAFTLHTRIPNDAYRRHIARTNPEKKSCDHVSRQSADALFGGDCSHFPDIVRLAVANNVCSPGLGPGDTHIRPKFEKAESRRRQRAPSGRRFSAPRIHKRLVAICL